MSSYRDGLASMLIGVVFVGPAIAGEPTRLFNGNDLRGWTIFNRHPDKSTDPTTDPEEISGS